MKLSASNKAISLILALAASGCALFGCGEARPVTELICPELPEEFEAAPIEYFRENMKHGVNFSCWDGQIESSGKPFVLDESNYKLVSEAGYDHIRLPVGFTQIGADEDYTITENEFNCMDRAINYAFKYKLMVILDVHFFGNPGINAEPISFVKAFYSIWRQLSEHYKDYSYLLAFEILNEPNDNLKPDSMDTIQNKAIEIIRETNPTRVIAAAANNINGVWSLDATKLPSVEDDPNIMAAVHIYSPMNITHQGTDWENNPSKMDRVGWYAEAGYAIDSDFDVIKQYRERTGRFVFVGEWGVCHRIADEQTVKAYYQYFSEKASVLEIPWTIWEFNASFGIYNSSSKKWQPWAESLALN